MIQQSADGAERRAAPASGTGLALRGRSDTDRDAQISQAGGDTGERVLRLEGELKGPWVNELRRISWDAATGNGTRADGLVVDLADVLFIGAEGLALLRELVGRHVRLRNGSPFVTEQLRETGNGDR